MYVALKLFVPFYHDFVSGLQFTTSYPWFLFALKTIFEGFGNHLVGKRYIFIVYLDKQNTLKKTTPTQQLLQTRVFVSLYEKVVLWIAAKTLISRKLQ